MLKELRFTKVAHSPASAADLAELEAALGVKLPSALAEFCIRWNGGLPDEENEFYPVPKAFSEFFHEYGDESIGVIADQLLGATKEFKACSLLHDYLLLNEASNLGIFPISCDLMGNQVVLRADAPTGPVYWRDQDLWEYPDNPAPGPQFAERPRLIPISDDLESFYNSLTFDPDK